MSAENGTPERVTPLKTTPKRSTRAVGFGLALDSKKVWQPEESVKATMSSTLLLEADLTKFCRSESLSEDDLHEIFERHGIAPNNNDITGSIDNEFFHEACRNERVTEGILRCLIEYFPNAVRYTDRFGWLPIHRICANKNVTLGLVQLLLDVYPESVRHEYINGSMPLHFLCQNNNNLDEEVGLEILKLLIEKCPESVRHATRNGNMLPIHFAAAYQSPEFCRILIEAYPGSEWVAGAVGIIPFHRACSRNTVATVKYLHQLFPESINVADTQGNYPIHRVIFSLKFREDNSETAVEMVQFLLGFDPNVVLQKLRDKLPLYWVCRQATNEDTPKLNAHLKVLHMLYDAYPQAIESNEVTSTVGNFCQEVQTFINTQITYARQARDHTLMTTRDENGQLPLHRALRENAILGSIKLLVKGNYSAVQTPDSDGALPLHLACLHYDCARIVAYLIGLDPTTLSAVDAEGNTALHYACRGAKLDTIMLLLDKYGGVSVSARNAHNKLPIHLLLESNEVSGRESIEYTESIYRLVRAYPDTLL